MSVQKQAAVKAFFPILFVFLLLSSITIIFAKALRDREVDQGMLIAGNIVLFLVTFLSFFLYRRALVAGNTQAFLRNVYSGMLLKFFVCIAAIFIYVFNAGTGVNKPALFMLMFLYLVYTFLEMALLMKQSRQIKQKRNA